MNRWARPLLVAGVLGTAAFLLYVGVGAMGEEEPPVQRVGLVRVFPEGGSVAVRQGAVGAELSFAWDGRLRIDRTEIPDDQLDRIAGINRISFTPGQGKEIEALDEGRHCATVTYWPSASDPATSGRPYTWCFTAA